MKDYLFLIIAGFFLGSIMFARIIPKAVKKIDICSLSDDQNPGSANAFIHGGVFVGMACLILDLLKGFLPVFLAYTFLDSSNLLFALVMVAPVLGHATGVLTGGKGGKCIATAFGVLLGIFPSHNYVLILACFYILFSTLLKINPNRRRSIVTFVLFGIFSAVLAYVEGQFALGAGSVAVSLIVIYKHLDRAKIKDKFAKKLLHLRT